MVGLWGIGFFSYDLVSTVLKDRFEAEGLAKATVDANVGFWTGMVSIVQNIGGFCGIYAFSVVTHYTGRRPAFAVSFLAAMVSTAYVFWYLEDVTQFVGPFPVGMLPIFLMGFCQLALFGGYAIYFPELFPTRLRSTGTSFCYNVGRFIAAGGPLGLDWFSRNFFSDYAQPMRPAGVTMCAIFLLGLAVLPFAPETKGRPLPE